MTATATEIETGVYAEIPLLNQFHWKCHFVDEVQGGLMDRAVWRGIAAIVPGCFWRGISAEAPRALMRAPEAMAVNELPHLFGRMGERVLHKPQEQRLADEFLAAHMSRNTDRCVQRVDKVRAAQIPDFCRSESFLI